MRESSCIYFSDVYDVLSDIMNLYRLFCESSVVYYGKTFSIPIMLSMLKRTILFFSRGLGLKIQTLFGILIKNPASNRITSFCDCTSCFIETASIE
jgi:hypothetical protein